MKSETIKDIALPILTSKGLFLVDLNLSKNNVIELLIDSLSGVNIQTCIDISREIEKHLNRDKEDFELTVCSAGIGYPFKVEGQFQKNLNKLVEVKTNNNTIFTGTLKAYDDGNVTIEYEEKKTIEGSKKKQLIKTEKQIPRKEIKEIKDVVVF